MRRNASHGLKLERLFKNMVNKYWPEDVGEKPKVEISARMKSSAGKAVYTKNLVRLSEHMLESDSFDIDEIKNTIIHELAHLISYERHGSKGRGHGMRWKRVMRELGVSDPQRCYKGRLTEPRYKVQCVGCGQTIGRYTNCKLVQQPDAYRCTDCGEHFELI